MPEIRANAMWPEIIEQVRKDHNGVFRVDLYFGHDGDNVCKFSDYDRELATGDSGRSMQEAVERCYSNWRFMMSVNFATKYGDMYEKCQLCGRENWTHQHPELYGRCDAGSAKHA